MLKLYAVPISLYCAKLRIVLRHKELEWHELLPPGGYGSDEYKKIIPAGNLPALVHGDLVLGDSEAIVEYLNEAFETPAMLPVGLVERAKVRERSRFHDTRLEPALRGLFGHISSEKRGDEFVCAQWSFLQQRLDQFTLLIPKTVENLYLGDCGFAITNIWVRALAKHFDLPITLSPAFETYIKQVSEFNAVADELADYQPRLLDWLANQ